MGAAFSAEALGCETDRSRVLRAVRKNPSDLHFVAEHFRSDREVVLAAVELDAGHVQKCDQ
eukprot:2413751-Amphidinium_carterae.1